MFEYILKISSRKTISISINDEGMIEVKAPRFITKGVIEGFLDEKSNWISKQQSKVVDKLKKKKKFESGEMFLFLGNEYELRFVETQKNSLVLEECFTIKNGSKDKVKKTFEKWYKTEARKYFLDRLVDFSDRYGYKFQSLKLSSAKRRWGSCSSVGNINLNWKLIMASEKIVNYVIVHELVHTEFHDHSKNFWNAVEAVLPDYKKLRKWLKDNGHTLTM